MIRVEATVDMQRSPPEVFAFISNFANNPRWQAGMVEARFTPEGPLQVGSTYSQVAKFLGRRIVSEFVVLEYEPQRRVKATSSAGSFPITFTRTVESVRSGARVSAIVEGDASGFFRVAEPLMAFIVQRSVQGDYRRLTRLLECADHV